MAQSLSEIILQLEQANQALQAQLGDINQALSNEREAGRRERDQEFEDAKKVSYDEGYAKGFEDGKNSVPPPPPPDDEEKLYSQAQLDAAVASAVSPLNEQVAAMQLKLDELQLLVDGFQGRLDEAVAKALSDYKEMLMQSYEAQQVAESESETGFKELLK